VSSTTPEVSCPPLFEPGRSDLPRDGGTSNLDGEISRLNTKLHLVRDYIETVRQKRSLLYQKTVEMLLFVAAVASVMQVLLPVPVIESAVISYTILITALWWLGYLQS
jgi:hypothetical protein